MTAEKRRNFSRGEKSGFFCMGLGLAGAFIHPLLAALPLLIFLLLCAVAPYVRCCGFFLPVISRGKVNGNQVALSFDDGPDPRSTSMVLDLLRKHSLPATFFVVGERVRRHPELLRRIIEDGHSVGLHSMHHDIFLATRSVDRVTMDLDESQKTLAALGVRSFVFRPPVGITSPRLAGPLARAGLLAVSFSCSAGDRGNRNIRRLADKILSRLRPGAIIMLHDLPPPQERLLEQWQKELDHLFGHMLHYYTVISLEQLIKHPISATSASGPARQ